MHFSNGASNGYGITIPRPNSAEGLSGSCTGSSGSCIRGQAQGRARAGPGPRDWSQGVGPIGPSYWVLRAILTFDRDRSQAQAPRGTGPNIRLIRPCLSAVLTPSGFHSHIFDCKEDVVVAGSSLQLAPRLASALAEAHWVAPRPPVTRHPWPVTSPSGTRLGSRRPRHPWPVTSPGGTRLGSRRPHDRSRLGSRRDSLARAPLAQFITAPSPTAPSPFPAPLSSAWHMPARRRTTCTSHQQATGTGHKP